MQKNSLSLIILFSLVFSLSAQIIRQPGSAEILLNLQKLNTVGSVLYVAAHPDDENTRLLGYLANERKLRTGYLSLTRGDGGQNLIGKEQGELLGLIRTQELLAARRTDGAEQFFTRANDFGFSKNPEETFSIWNKDSILADVVYTIRKFRPDVIICRFPTTGEGGHGHHTASAILAVEAFDAAADPKRFPEQLKYVKVWQAKRIFWNTFNFGGNNTTAPNQLKIDVGVFNPLLGKGYGEIAADSRSMHKSQGFGSANQRGSNIEYFKLLKGDSVKTDLFEGISTNWNRLKGTEKLQKQITDCTNNYKTQSPELSVAALVAIYKSLMALDDKDNSGYWKQLKLKETEKLLLACSGLWIEAFASDYIAIPGQEINITSQIVNRNKGTVKLNKLSFLNQTDTTTAIEMKVNELYSFKHKEKLSTTASYSNPYWLNREHAIGLYSVNDPLLVGVPENDPATKVVFDITILDLNLKIDRNIVYKYTDPVKGEVYRPLEILPPATVNISEKAYVFTDGKPQTVKITIKANANNIEGDLLLYALGDINFQITSRMLPNGRNSDLPDKSNIKIATWHTSANNPHFKLMNKGDEIIIDAIITPTKEAQWATLFARLMIGTDTYYSKSIKRVEYDHIPYQFILSEAKADLRNMDLKKTGDKIGYIPGAGDDIPACLQQIGYNVTILTDELLATEDLSKYPTIVTGIRAYNTNERLQVYYNKLMAYVKNGGNLVVQYNTNSRVGPVAAKIGPYPFTVSRDRVTNENAEVRFKNDSLYVLNYPNKITKRDFDNWVQERGIYFATDLDSNYQTVFSMNDPNEKASDGSLIITPYGKGNFVYTGLAFFRELPAGVPGAYRLFVNLLSLPQN
ncbi:MAG: PIG-L family deacetylase [Bacteroidota bacterium]